MREPRNPFRLRASEHIESVETFVSLFSPEVLDMLGQQQIWDQPQIIRSAPGGGKTSLLRLFTPASLRTIYALRTREYTKDIFKRLSALEAVDDDGPQVLGVFLSCAHSFATLDDLALDEGRKRRLFFSLLNSRIMLAALHGALALKQKSYPDQLPDISMSKSCTICAISDSLSDLSGSGLFSWAERLERAVCEALDSFLPLSEANLPGHDSLDVLSLLSPECLLCDGAPIAKRVVIMLDDVHRLTATQRRWLLDEILSIRPSVSVWIAERLEALTVDELLSPGVTQGRDYGSIVTIEDYWRSNRSGKFEKLVSSIGDRRARDAREVEIAPFASCLQDSLDGDEWQEAFRQAISVVVDRVKGKTSAREKFSEWISERESIIEAPPREILLAWRTLEILIEREIRRSQQSFDYALGADELEQRDAADVRGAAELFVAREFNLPYYFGLARLASLASSNIEQFLWLSGDIFEECVSAALLKQPTNLPPPDQERILSKTIRDAWREIPQRVRHGTHVLRWLEAIGTYARWETYKPNAPYAPGVTGIAISMADRDKLQRVPSDSLGKELRLLADIIGSCIAHNLIEVNLNLKCKGQYWMVMYLNRMLCVQFNLPLQYGGWRERQLPELLAWMNKGYAAPDDGGGLFK